MGGCLFHSVFSSQDTEEKNEILSQEENCTTEYFTFFDAHTSGKDMSEFNDSIDLFFIKWLALKGLLLNEYVDCYFQDTDSPSIAIIH